MHCTEQNNTTLFVHGLKLWYHVLPPGKLHNPGNLAIGTMNFPSHFPPFLGFPFMHISSWVYPLGSRRWCWVGSWLQGFGMGQLVCSLSLPPGLLLAFPSVPIPACWLGFGRERLLLHPVPGRYTLLQGIASGCANKPLFPISRQHQPLLCLPPLQWCREEKGSPVYLTLLCPL